MIKDILDNIVRELYVDYSHICVSEYNLRKSKWFQVRGKW